MCGNAELTSRNLELALKDIEGKKSLLEEASAKLQQESDRLKQLLSDTTSERDNFRDDARKAAEQLAIAKEENISLNGQITLAQGDVEALKREKEELHKQHDQDAAERARISAELEEVHSKSKLIEAELAEKNGSIVDLQSKLDELNNKLLSSQLHEKSLAEEMESLVKKLQEETQKLELLSKERSEEKTLLEAKIGGCEERIQALMKQASDLSCELQKSKDESKKLLTEVSRRDEEISNVSGQLSSSLATSHSLSEQLAKTKQEMDAAISQMHQQLDTATLEKEGITSKLNATIGEKESLQQRLTQERDQNQEQQRALKARLDESEAIRAEQARQSEVSAVELQNKLSEQAAGTGEAQQLLAQATSKITEISGRLTASQKENESLSRQLSEHRATQDQLIKARQEMEVRLAEIQRQLDIANADKESSKTKLDEALEEKRALESSLHKNMSDLAEVNSKLKQAELQLQQLKSDLSNQNDANAGLKSTLKELQSQLDTSVDKANRERDFSSQFISRLQSEITSVSEKNKLLQTKVSSLEHDLSLAEGLNKDRSHQLELALAERDSSRNLLTTSDSNTITLSSELEVTKQHLHSAEATAKQLAAHVASLEKQIASLKEELEVHKTTKGHLNEKLNESNHELERQLQERRLAHEQFTSDKEKLEAELQETRATIRDLREKLQANTEESSVSAKSSFEQKVQLEKQVKDAQSQLHQLQGELQKTSASLLEKEAALCRLSDSLNSTQTEQCLLKEQLAQLKSENESLSTTKGITEQQLQERNSDIIDMQTKLINAMLQVQTSTDEIAHLSEKLLQLEQRTKRAELSLTQSEQNCEALQLTAKGQAEKIKYFEQQLEEKDSQLSCIQAQKAALEQKHQQHLAVEKEAQEELVKLRSQLSERCGNELLAHQVEELNCEFRRLQTESNSLKDSFDQCQKILESKDIELGELANEKRECLNALEKAKSQWTEQTVEYTEQIEKLSQQLAQEQLSQETLLQRSLIAEGNLQTRLQLMQETMNSAQAILTGQFSIRPDSNKNISQKLSAYQAHSSMLASELKRLETELNIKDGHIKKLIKDLEDCKRLVLTKQQSEVPQSNDLLRLQLEEVKKRYFVSLARAVKMQGALLGWYANVDVDFLYEQAQQQNVDLDKWPGWITAVVESSKQMM
ncbi:hypothetical protein Pelo_3441 [Pelomyxa schiedti]|nr:hypothetical protein Pelo_3441 [Pelomyxa schiedti]